MFASMINSNLNHSLNQQNIENHIINELYPNPDNMTYEELLELGEKIGNVSRGISQEKIDKIPQIKYKRISYRNKVINNETCPVCHEDFVEGERLKKLHCNHIYHNDCISVWLKKEKKCPFCKEEIIVEENI